MKAVRKTCAYEQDFNVLCLQQPRNLATMQRRLLSSADSNFGVVLQHSSGVADCMATVVVHLDTPAQQHELQEINSQVFLPPLHFAASMLPIQKRILVQYVSYPVLLQHRYAGC